MKWWTCVVVVCASAVLADDDWLDVNTAQGPVRGRKHVSGQLYEFYNIPYATTPVGVNKFKAPLPPPEWTDRFDAFGDEGNIICPQNMSVISLYPYKMVMKEDCLVANVFVPATNERNLSVVVHVHGGAFVMGFGNIDRATQLMEKEKDFVMVTFNYRLSIHGFLCLGTEDAPGNAGMKDQVALLHWVQQNIANFHGNPKDVTLVGSSAGSTAVDLLMLSKSAEGLFHRVIADSGGNLATFAIQRDPLEIAKTFARDQNIDNVDDINALEQFYKTASINVLTSDWFLDKTDATVMFSPCVERDTGDEAFLTESPLTIFKKGNYRKLPVLYGFANMEGLFRINFYDLWMNMMNEKFSDFLSADLEFESDAEREEVANKVKTFYFSDNPVGNHKVLGYINYFTDVLFAHPMLWAVKLQVEAGNNQIYLYEYVFVDDNTPTILDTDLKGATHCAQTAAWMDNIGDRNENSDSPEYKKMRKLVREMWHNFIKTGKPVPEGSLLPEWPAAGADRSPHMILDKELTLGGVVLKERTRFWEEIYQKHYRDAIPPHTDDDWLDVNTAQGPVRGRKHASGQLYEFYNIPYATTPVGVNKFKAPLPPPEWTDRFEAIGDEGNIICPQNMSVISLYPYKLLMKEDCLIANVFVPATNEKNLSVVVYVHGGAFVMGFGNMDKATQLMEKEKDFIMVTFNYRLGIHGFLCLGTEDAPGNAGMKDQVALLRWVQQNIASFGGNPNDITLVGGSAGSASVDLLMLSKSAEGLFHRVIADSGGNLAAFAIQRDPIEIAKTFARDQNFANVDDINALEQFYKTASIDVLTSDWFLDKTDATFMVSPCVEPDVDGAFLTESPLTIFKKGNYRKLPLLYGFANMEGLFRISFYDLWMIKMNEKFSDFLPADLEFVSDAEKEEVANKVKTFYFGNNPAGNDEVLGYINYFTDVLFAQSMLWAVKLHVEAGNNQVYLYEYHFVDDNTPYILDTDLKGATHCAQTGAWMDNIGDRNESSDTPEYKEMRKLVREMWHNFMKTGKPVPEGSLLPEWPAAGADRSPHMILDKELTLGGVLLEERTRFWEEIYQKHYRDAIPPHTDDDWLDVNTAQGPVRGRKHSSGQLYEFYNIPYATTPVGVNKFKAPLPPPEWTDRFEAIGDEGNIICPQNMSVISLYPYKLLMKEDCLIANVFVPATNEKNLSVVVYVHGGAFVMGFGNMDKATQLMEKEKDFIMVTFNYRLGIHGFLCLGTEDAPGNAGMKDQVALLRWVQQNIASFGGNPNDITLVGGSAGSASVDLLMLSKSAEGLFHRVIADSGGNLAVFTIQRDPLDIAKKHARTLNALAIVDDINALEQFYKTASMDLLTADMFFDRTDSTFMFSPCVERDVDGAFLTESPLTIFKKGNYRKLPLLYGFANMEGLFRINFFDIWKNKMNEKFSDFLPADLQFGSDAERERVANVVKTFYFGDNPVGNDEVLGYIDFFTDVLYSHSKLWAVKLQVEAGNNEVYLYEYSFVDENSASIPYTDLKGATHCAQTAAWMDNLGDRNEISDTSEYKKMRTVVREMWHNFIKTGKPVPEGSLLPEWPAAGADRSPHMILDKELTLGGVLLEERTRFWEEIYQKHYRDAIPPHTDDDWLDVNTAQGPVRGRKHSSGQLYEFYNIPYATTPVGVNKFMAPLPPPEWTDRFEAVGDEGNIICPQNMSVISLYPYKLLMKEDCLIANVFVPATNEKNLSVVVYVHGGAFVMGFGNMDKATQLMEKEKDFIMVTFNYRLGIHGFLCLGTEDAPGNAGMKDQVALLRWVQQNIASFGGNPNDITLVGGSAGSASVDLLMLSKSAEGLFHRVIADSGGNLAVFTIQRDPLYIAKKHARTLNALAIVDDINALEQFYKTASMDLLTADMFFDRTDSTFMFSPCVERDVDGAFLTESPLTIFKKGNYRKLPLLYGFANMEGLFRINFFDIWKNKMNEKFSDFLPADLQFGSDAERERVANVVKTFYFGDNPVGNDEVLGYIDFFTDVLYSHSKLWAVKLQVEAGNNEVYLYEYSFVDENSASIPYTDLKGATHCAQTAAWMDNLGDRNEISDTSEYKKMRTVVREMWHNFIKTGKPVPEGSLLPEWPAAGADRSPHMILDKELTLGGVLLEERTRFWEEIYQKHYRDAIPPHTDDDWLDVNTAQGPVRGRKHSSGQLYEFYNIPYATTPVGVNKFKAPLPPPEWTDRFEAVGDEGNIICPQNMSVISLYPYKLLMKEDCLIANVFVPATNEKNLSVVVYVHGGAFVMGFGNMDKATQLMEKEKDFIMVTFNYRLSIHGFLCLGTEDAPGNAGMKDQVALLRWVQQNIASFGGNPNDITLVGSSAGSASVDLLMLSKSAEGLFHRVIADSGGNLAVFTIQRDPLDIAKKHARTLNALAIVDDINALEQFYKTASMDLLTADMFFDRTDSTFMFSPCVERDVDGAFLTESPLTIFKKGNYRKLPLLYGFANMEGLFRINFFDIWKNKMNEKFSDFLPADLQFGSDAERERVANVVKTFYFGDNPVGNDEVLGYIDFFTDVLYSHSKLWAVKLQVEAGNNEVYLYEYSFVDENSASIPYTDLKGATHCAQTAAWMDNLGDRNEISDTSEYKKMRTVVREMWHNFIKTGKPVPENSSLPAWPAAGADRSPHMVLDEKLELGGVLLEERTHLWEEIYQKHYRDAVPPRSGASRMTSKNIFSLFVFYIVICWGKGIIV